MQTWLRLDHKQTCYLTQKCDTHQIEFALPEAISESNFRQVIF